MVGSSGYENATKMESNNNLVMGQDGDVGISVLGGSSRIQEKIEVVQQVLTLLESTMSSAKSEHIKKQALDQSKIDELELQIQNLKHALERDKEDFKEISGSLENGIQKYLLLENKLLTIEERSHDDYVVLPDLSASTDIYVAQYLPPKYSEWQRLKQQCEVLNHCTQNSFRDNISVRRYQVSVGSNSAGAQRYLQEKANALNLFRGKKVIAASPSQSGHVVNLTWYKNETAASHYAQTNYHRIIEQVFKEQYEEFKGRNIEITELYNVNEPEVPLMATELTIHVLPKTSSSFNAHSIPRRITLYQFDEDEAAACVPPPVPTLNVEPAAPTIVETINNNETGKGANSSIYVPPIENQGIQPLVNKEVLATKRRRNSKVKSKRSPGKQLLLQRVDDDVLSLIGLRSDNTTNSNENASASVADDSTNTQQQTFSKVSSEIGVVDFINDPEPITAVDILSGLSECAKDYIQEKGIEKLTDIQKQVIRSFKMPGDILYEGVSNGGKTIGVVIGLINCINLGKNSVQALIVTSNSRSSKLVQNRIESTDLMGTRHTVICQRIDELLDVKESKTVKGGRLKIIKKPPCHILVGTLEEMRVYVLKNLVNKDDIRFLVLHKAEDIYGSVIEKQKANAMSVNQILYALDATIKVIVVRRTMVQCAELDVFCQRKLREKQYFKETIDISETFLNKQRHVSDGTKSTSSTSASTDSVYPASLQEYSESDSNDNNRVVVKAVASTSKSFVSVVPACTSSSEGYIDSEGTVENEEEAEEEEPAWRTCISEQAMQLLGISRNIGKSAEECEPEYADNTITHLYANIESGDEASKIDMISMLNLEEDKAIIFCDTVAKAEWISTRLRQNQLWPQVLHEDVLPKDQRVILQNYRQGSFCRLLICTDFVTSVSLDAADIVVNFTVPKSKYIYLSRAAFAARQIKQGTSPGGDTKGVVVNLSLNEFQELQELETSLGITIHNCED